MRYLKTYFVRGPVIDCYKIRMPYALKDPPVAGLSHAFILGKGDTLTLFHPFTLQAYKIPKTALEITAGEVVYYDPTRMADLIEEKCGEYKMLQMQRPYKLAWSVVAELRDEASTDIFA